MATEFSQLGLDPDTVKVALDAAEIDYSAYTDEELESLGLVSNLILLDGISDKSTEIDEELAVYEIEVNKLSAMQDVLNDFSEQVQSSSPKLDEFMTFVTTDNTFFDIDDASTVIVDYTPSLGQYYTEPTYDTLQDYIEALDSNVQLTHSVSGEDYDLVLLEAWQAGLSSDYYYKLNGNVTGLEQDVIDGDAYFWSYLEGVNGDDILYMMTYEEVKNYLVAKAMQDAGYIGDEVTIEPWLFASIDQPDFADEYSGELLEWVQLSYGKVTVDFDSSAGTVQIDYNGTAAIWEMGLEFLAYLGSYDNNVDEGGFEWPELIEDLGPSLVIIFAFYAFDTAIDPYYLSNYPDDYGDPMDATGTGGIFDGYDTATWDNHFDDKDVDEILSDTNADTLTEAMATAIESQSTTSEVQLLTVNSGITEWGELNDVWDLCHEYIHDALKKASDNWV